MALETTCDVVWKHDRFVNYVLRDSLLFDLQRSGSLKILFPRDIRSVVVGFLL